ncbi:thiopeptide-type bacteriocin biosynthesis protein [Streptomyces sp. NPDC091292]|uniref:thiopeptide-type bacteriocin biosynthesis protein n=1 Tax=Streptomyces sp. NPDC091292 TaxID=3365991 RepID=UPI0037F48F4C
MLTPFAWGAAARPPFLPEVRVGRPRTPSGARRQVADGAGDLRSEGLLHRAALPGADQRHRSPRQCAVPGRGQTVAADPYEPETVAFDGPRGMTLAHDLFHTDSIGVFDYHQHAADRTSGLLGARETSLLVTALFLRAAELEWGEQGDVWGQVETRSLLPVDVFPDQISRTVDALRRLPAADAGPLAPLQTWATGMEFGARALAESASGGNLHLDLRHPGPAHPLPLERHGLHHAPAGHLGASGRKDDPGRLTLMTFALDHTAGKTSTTPPALVPTGRS